MALRRNRKRTIGAALCVCASPSRRFATERILPIVTATRFINTATLNIAYEESGPSGGPAILLLHGFPYDVRQYDELRSTLNLPHARLIVPYLRGFGATSYRAADSFRSGQQAAIGKDVLDLLDALQIGQAVLVGYDWGGRAACIAAALWPDRVRGLVSTGYNVQNIAKSAATPQAAEQEHQLWYQWYFQTDRGRLGLEQHRRDICRLLWTMWSPQWQFHEKQFLETAASFDNADFVDTAIHSYRHRYGNAAGDPALESLEDLLASQPDIRVPSITVHGEDDRVEPASVSAEEASHFKSLYHRRIVPGAGHCIPAEAPAAMSRAIHDILESS